MQDPLQVKNLANLARIDISDEMIDGAVESINNILSLMNQLQSIDTRGVRPMAHPMDVHQRLRKDVITENDQRETLQATAPVVETVENGLYLVPKVID